LIFSKSPIIEVRVSIDSKYLGNAVQSIDNQNLYVYPWNASVYNDGNHHQISVEIKDNQNNIIKSENEFSLSTTTITAWTRSKFVLFVHWPTFVKIIFFFLPKKISFILGSCYGYFDIMYLYSSLNILSISSKTNNM
jgi:hypothetical protein